MTYAVGGQLYCRRRSATSTKQKVDTFPEDKVIYLKPISMSDGFIHFRVEAAVRKQGVVLHRAEIGEGHASIESGYPIFMDIGPFVRTLVLEAA